MTTWIVTAGAYAGVPAAPTLTRWTNIVVLVRLYRSACVLVVVLTLERKADRTENEQP